MKKINPTNLAFLIVITLFLILILETITFIIGFKINNYCFFVALLTVAIYINRNKISVLETLIFLLILIISYFISILFLTLLCKLLTNQICIYEMTIKIFEQINTQSDENFYAKFHVTKIK